MQIPDDRAHLLAFISGDRKGAEALIAQYANPLINHAMHMLGGDRARAEDMVQESFLKLWQHAQSLLARDEPLYLRAWLYRVTTNAVLDEKRKPIWDGDDGLDQIMSDAPAQDILQERKERAIEAMALVGQLPERQRAAILMSHFEDMGNAEIAEVLEIGVEAVESLLARGRRKLRELTLGIKVVS